jgi:O-antigen/teichoic acid export membrane protein
MVASIRRVHHRVPWASLQRRLGPPLGVALLLLIGPLLLFAPVTLGGRTLVPYDALITDPVYRPLLTAAGVTVPHNDLVADLVFQNVVWKTFLVQTVHSGQLPLWNPNVLGGLPFLAAGQHSGLYPTVLLFLWLGPDRAFGWAAVLNLWLAGLAMYVFARALGLGRFAGCVMGLAWSLSSLLVMNTVFPMIQGALAWAPVVLAGIEWTARAAAVGPPTWLPRGRAAAALAALALSVALVALAGHVEMLYYTALVAGAYGLFRVVALVPRQGRRSAAVTGVWLVAAAGVGGLLAGVQLVPLAELAQVNWRSGAAAYDTVIGYAFGLRQAVTFLVPDFYGNPAHHTVLDVLARQRVPLGGHAMWGTAWGTKNYVEAAAYLGLLVPLLAVVGLANRRRRAQALFWLAVAGLSLTFVFGLPTYRLLFFGLPGFNQLHTPFRWVFPLALAVTVLGGLGADGLARAASGRAAARRLGAAALVAAAIAGALVVGSWLAPQRAVVIAERLLARAPVAREAVLAHFPTVSAFASYELWRGLHLAVFLALAGAVLTLLARPLAGRARTAALGLALVTIFLDLVLVARGFYPALDPALAHAEPAAVHWLRDAEAAKWGRVVGFGDARVLWPNSAARHGVPDLRGYDSIIPRWTVDTLNAIEDQACAPPGDDDGDCLLQFNRVGNLQRLSSLAHPMLTALGGRYIVSSTPLADPNLRLVYDDEVRIYENERALPRAWVVTEATVVPDRAALLAALDHFDPRHSVLLESAPRQDIWRTLPVGRPVPSVTKVRSESPNHLELDVTAPQAGLLVVSDTWFPGWRAQVVEGAGAAFGGQAPTVEVPVYRADGMLRAVPVPAGRSTVRLEYSPMSVKLGLYATFLGLIALLLLAAYALWQRFVHVEAGDTARTVAVNSGGPMMLALVNKVVDFAFAMLMLRVLGPSDAGAYYTIISIIGFADIFTNFGLNLLVARDVARAPERAGEYLTHTTVLRVVLWLLSLPVLAGYVFFRQATGAPLGAQAVLALALFAGALLPSNLNAALSSIFQAHERMMVPAAVAIVTNLLKVTIGALVLLAGFSFVGLAATSVVVNWITLAILVVLALRAGYRAATVVVPAAVWAMVGVSLPLMLNHLLQSVFFKIDVLLLSQMKGDEVVGWYSAAYKWVDAFLIIPAYTVLALFPLMSRRAADDRPGLGRAFEMARRWLVILALPIAVTVTFLADELVGLLGGREYLPHGAQALRIMIWFLPFSFINGLSQYVLIAIGRQRWITLSFAVAVTFNLVANVVAIPPYGYVGAAVVTILTELVLMVPFQRALTGVAPRPLLTALWRPALAASAMALTLAVLDTVGVPRLIAAGLAVPVFAATLWRLGGVTAEDRGLLARLGPRRPDHAVAPAEAPTAT